MNHKGHVEDSVVCCALQDHPFQSVFEQRDIEVDKQSEASSGEFQVGQELGLVKGTHVFNGF